MPKPLQNYISPSTFRDVLSLRNDYLSALASVGFIPIHCSASDPAFNDNSQNGNLLKAIIYAGTARLVKVKLPKAVFDKGIGGAIERERESREVKFYEKEEGTHTCCYRRGVDVADEWFELI